MYLYLMNTNLEIGKTHEIRLPHAFHTFMRSSSTLITTIVVVYFTDDFRFQF